MQSSLTAEEKLMIISLESNPWRTNPVDYWLNFVVKFFKGLILHWNKIHVIILSGFGSSAYQPLFFVTSYAVYFV